MLQEFSYLMAPCPPPWGYRSVSYLMPFAPALKSLTRWLKSLVGWLVKHTALQFNSRMAITHLNQQHTLYCVLGSPLQTLLKMTTDIRFTSRRTSGKANGSVLYYWAGTIKTLSSLTHEWLGGKPNLVLQITDLGQLVVALSLLLINSYSWALSKMNFPPKTSRKAKQWTEKVRS